MTMTFHLHPQLEKDCIAIGRLTLCRLLLMNDKQFPWFILVPEIEGITEIFQLNKQQRSLLIEESSYLAEQLKTLYKADKINIAAIGNLVPQLHVHHVVRYRSDKAWPAPVWGKFSAIPYSGQELTELSVTTTSVSLNWL
jgi:diadenosine tetraphosphate (Ap4A) HIT family hydrolase